MAGRSQPALKPAREKNYFLH